MIRTRRVTMLSGKTIGAFGPHAKAEWRRAKPLRRDWYASLDGLWIISWEQTPLCVLGLKRGSYLGLGGEVFFLLCRFPKQRTAELVKFLRRGLRRVTKLWHRLVVRVEHDFWIGRRFVEYFGFKKFATEPEHDLFEMRATWQ